MSCLAPWIFDDVGALDIAAHVADELGTDEDGLVRKSYFSARRTNQ